MILTGAISITKAIGRGGPGNRDLWALIWSEASAIWVQKSLHKIIKSKSHIKNRYIGNFMYMGFRDHPLQWPLVL
jgi:hypothetical protein